MTKPIPALLKMYQQERNRIIKRIRQMVGCTSIAEELAQDTFIKLWQRPAGENDTPGLLHRTAHHLALDYLRAQDVRKRHQLEEQDSVTNDPPHVPSPERIAGTLQRWKSLQDQLNTLPERTKQVFLLNRVEGETYNAIAQKMGISISTVEKDMMRAMRLCQQWKKQQVDEEI